MNDGTVPMDVDNTPNHPRPSRTLTTRACHKCRVAEAALSRPLSHCSKCKTTLYCSRACQRADWKAHKKVCSDAANSSNGNNANTNANNADVARETSAVDPSLLDPKTLPSTFLKAYLLRLYDEHHFFDDDDDRRHRRPPVDTLLSSHGNPLRDYRRFLDRAEAAAAAGALAMPWWYWVPAGGQTSGKTSGKSGSSKGGSSGDGDGGISAVRQACEDLAKHGGRDAKNSTVVASLFDSKSEITSGDVVLEDEETLKTLRELAAKICGTTVVNSDEECE